MRTFARASDGLARLLRLVRAADGAAALEFAIAAPVFFAIVVPLVDLGLGLAQKMQVADAAEAGAQYVLLHPCDPTLGSQCQSAIASAVQNATGLAAITATPAPSGSCGCPDGSTVEASACGPNVCSGGNPAGYYVTVSAQATYTPILSYVSIGGSVTLSAQSTVRLQ